MLESQKVFLKALLAKHWAEVVERLRLMHGRSEVLFLLFQALAHGRLFLV